MANQIADSSAPNTENFTVRRYLTEREGEKLMDTARKHSRHGHRDSTMILTAYRHGLRASEVCDLQWQQILSLIRAGYTFAEPSVEHRPCASYGVRTLRKPTKAPRGSELLCLLILLGGRTRKARRRGALGGSVSDQCDIAAARSRTRLRAACCDLCA
jgi:Phage integrase family